MTYLSPDERERLTEPVLAFDSAGLAEIVGKRLSRLLDSHAALDEAAAQLRKTLRCDLNEEIEIGETCVCDAAITFDDCVVHSAARAYDELVGGSE